MIFNLVQYFVKNTSHKIFLEVICKLLYSLKIIYLFCVGGVICVWALSFSTGIPPNLSFFEIQSLVFLSSGQPAISFVFFARKHKSVHPCIVIPTFYDCFTQKISKLYPSVTKALKKAIFRMYYIIFKMSRFLFQKYTVVVVCKPTLIIALKLVFK